MYICTHALHASISMPGLQASLCRTNCAGGPHHQRISPHPQAGGPRTLLTGMKGLSGMTPSMLPPAW